MLDHRPAGEEGGINGRRVVGHEMEALQAGETQQESAMRSWGRDPTADCGPS